MKKIALLLFSPFIILHSSFAAKPNVVLFLVDDMGWMDCGAYGSKYYETPNIDRFAQRAMRFTNAYAQPLCSPTRASILTGKYPARHGITTASGHQPPQAPGFNFSPDTGTPNRPLVSPISKNYLEPGEYTLTEALHDAGYRTAHIGKWHLGLIPPFRPEQNGFDVAFHCAPDPGPPGNYFSPYGVITEGRPTAKIKVGTITDGPPGEYIVDRQAQEAEKFIAASKDQPFFLNLWCYGVHGPWGHKPEYTAEFAKKKDPRGAQANPIMASMLRSVDECFGRILTALEKNGVAENTIVIFYSDNGGNTHSNTANGAKTDAAEKNKPEFMADWRKWAGDLPPTNNAPLREGKGTLYEGGTRVPMMWAWAGHIAPGTTTDALAAHIDLYPTVLDLLGLPKPAQQPMDGVSIASLLLGQGPASRQVFFNFFPFRPNEGGVTVRSGDFKLIRWFSPEVPRELYNLKADLGETQNLAAQMPDKVKELDAQIDGFLKDTGALVPKPNLAYKARPLRGWVAQGCTAEERDGALVVTGKTRTPFLGYSGLKLKGPVTLTVKARTSSGGPAKVQWRNADQDTFPAEGQVLDFNLPASKDGAETKITFDAANLLHMRLFLPAQTEPVAVDSIELKPENGQSQLWDFEQK
jgi:arylsulfatase A-like enzyme